MSEQVDFKTSDASSYDLLADRFDHYTELVSEYAVDTLLDTVSDCDGDIIDIGCGTGIVTLEAGRRFGGDKKIIGVDLSDGMLDLANRKAEANGLSDAVKFEKADAENLPFSDNSIGAAVSLYAIRHFPHPEKAFEEIFRVVKPGGRIAVAAGSSPSLFSINGIAAAVKRISREIMQHTGRELAACDHIDSLVQEFLPSPTASEVAEWTEHRHGYSGSLKTLACLAGFHIVKDQWIGKQFEIASVQEFWELQTTFSSVARKRLKNARPKDVKTLKDKFDEQCNAVLARGGRLVYRVGTAVVIANKPL